MKKSSVLGLGALCVMGLIGATELRANGGAISALVAPKTAVAVVDLERLMDALTEVKDMRKQLSEVADKREKELEQLGNNVKSLDEELKILANGSKERFEKVAAREEAKLMGRARQSAYQELMDLDSGEVVRRMYLKIVEAVDAFAKKEGFELVLMDDRQIKLPEVGKVNTMNAAIQAKRILFAADTLDVTDRIVTIMNTEYGAPSKRK
ncbi:MAG TPA: OmpH family outer membrane protein [Phycisphaerales bacterium]|nr:OmpH family outer membrane protein [Phycisphaerales bacterium]